MAGLKFDQGLLPSLAVDIEHPDAGSLARGETDVRRRTSVPQPADCHRVGGGVLAAVLGERALAGAREHRPATLRVSQSGVQSAVVARVSLGGQKFLDIGSFGAA